MTPEEVFDLCKEIAASKVTPHYSTPRVVGQICVEIDKAKEEYIRSKTRTTHKFKVGDVVEYIYSGRVEIEECCPESTYPSPLYKVKDCIDAWFVEQTDLFEIKENS